MHFLDIKKYIFRYIIVQVSYLILNKIENVTINPILRIDCHTFQD